MPIRPTTVAGIRVGVIAVVAVAGLAAGSGTLAVAGPPVGPPAGASTPPRAVPGPTSSHTVTLVTGDVVTVSTAADGKATADVRPSRDAVGGVHTQTVGKDLYVIPDAALPLLAAGRIDRALFNVTGLIAQDYDDAHVSTVPLIAQYSDYAKSSANPLPGTTSVRALQSIGGVALTADKATTPTFWKALVAGLPAPPTGRVARPQTLGGGITKLWLDRKVRSTLAESNAQIGAPAAWSRGVSGRGVDVAILDTGIDATHPDLAGQIAATRSFVPGEGMADVNGHGTHTASTIAGTGAASGGLEKAVAHGARLSVGKVLSDEGSGAESWIIDGMEWAAGRAPIVSMSLGSDSPSDGTDPMDQAVNELSAQHGTLFVIAAGNTGAVGIGAPGAADAALTVGSVDSADHLSWFSSRGPRTGDGALKPDLVAPGEDILAARSAQSPGEGSYVRMSGTSMATPQVAGAAALLLQQHPTWQGPQLKAALLSGSKVLAGATAYEVGAGRLDVPAAAFPTIVASGALSFGMASFPHGDDQPVTRSVTYANLTAKAVTLDLAATMTDADGKPAPPGVFVLSASSVSVPARGTRSVTMTADPRRGTSGATYTGTLGARVGTKVVAHSAVALAVEGARYDLTLTATGRDGRPAGTFATVYRYGDPYASTVAVDGSTTMRVEPGTYTVTTWMDVPGTGGRDSTGVAMLGTPHVVVGKATTVAMDARKATEIDARTPRPTVDSVRRVGWFHDSGVGGPYTAFVDSYGVSPGIDDVFAAPSGPVGGGDFEYSSRWRRTAPTLELRTTAPRAQEIHPLALGGAPRLDGHLAVRGVYAGLGRAADYAGLPVRGQVVLVDRSDVVSPSDQATAATAAGVAMLLVVNDRPGRLYTYVGSAVPMATVTRAEGTPLVSAARSGTLRFDAVGTANPPYLYDLVDLHSGAIPADLVYAPRAANLATLEQRFVSATPGTVQESRYDCAAWFWPPCLGAFETVTTPSTRTDYVSTQPGTEWYQGAQTTTGLEQRGDRTAYTAGQQGSLTWFGPVTRPRLGTGYWLPNRSGDFMALNVPPASSGDQGLTGGAVDETAMQVESRLYAGSTLLSSGPFQAVQTDVPATDGRATYRFEQDTSRPAQPWVYSTRTHTAWTFRSQHTAEGSTTVQPFLQLDYHVATDLTGRVATGTPIPLSLRAFQMPGAVGAGTPRSATLSISYDDGLSWQPLPLSRAGATWSTTVTFPRGSGSFVSLRATGQDSAGNTVSQEVVRAFGLR